MENNTLISQVNFNAKIVEVLHVYRLYVAQGKFN